MARPDGRCWHPDGRCWHPDGRYWHPDGRYWHPDGRYFDSSSADCSRARFAARTRAGRSWTSTARLCLMTTCSRAKCSAMSAAHSPMRSMRERASSNWRTAAPCSWTGAASARIESSVLAVLSGRDMREPFQAHDDVAARMAATIRRPTRLHLRRPSARFRRCAFRNRPLRWLRGCVLCRPDMESR